MLLLVLLCLHCWVALRLLYRRVASASFGKIASATATASIHTPRGLYTCHATRGKMQHTDAPAGKASLPKPPRTHCCCERSRRCFCARESSLFSTIPPTCRTYTECISFALWMLRSLGLGSAAVKQAMPSNAFLCNVKKIAFCCSVVIYNFLPTPNGRCSRARPHSYVFVKT